MTGIEGRDLTAALGDCLEQLEAGRPLADTLRPYPEQAEELQSLLEMAVALRQLPMTPAPVAVAARIADALQREAAHERVLATRLLAAPSAVLRRAGPAWARVRNVRGTGRWRWAPRLAAGSALYGAATLAALLLVAAGAAHASADSLPGGALYPVKRSLERLHMLVVSSSAESQLAARLAARRLEEAAALEAAGRSPAPALAGLDALAPWVESFPAPMQTAVAAARGWDGTGSDAEGSAAPGKYGPPTPEAAVRATVAVRRGPLASVLLAVPTPIQPAAERPAGAAATAIAGAGPTDSADQVPTFDAAGAASLPETGPPAAVPGVAETAPRPARTAAATEWAAPATAVTMPHEDPPRPATDAPTTPPEPTEVPTMVAATATAVEPRSPGWDVVVGVVMSARGGGLDRAQVSFVDAESGQRVASVTTRGDGTYQQRLRAGRYLVVATAEGHRLQWFRGQPSREGAHPITLPGEGGRVTARFLLLPVQPLSRNATPQGREPPPTATADAGPTAWPEPTPEGSP